MKKIIALLLALSMIAVLSACGGSKTESKGEVNVYNWGEYIDEDIFDDFEEQTGIKVNYSTYESTETLYSILKTGGSSYDVIIPSDYMISRLISEDMLEKINFDNVPNFSLIDPAYKNLEYDPSGEYSVPYTWGTVGLIYNGDVVQEDVTSWSIMFDPQYAGQILMFDNSRDAMGIALKYLGYNQNTTDEAQLREAFDLLVQQKDILQAYVMDQIFDKMESGEAAIAPYYAGDYLVMVENNPSLKYVLPEEGSNLFVDAMCIPKGAENKENAEAFINFMCDTDIALANSEVTGYAPAGTEAMKIFSEDLDEDLYPVINPDKDVLANCDVFTNLPQETLDLYDSLWVDLKS